MKHILLVAAGFLFYIAGVTACNYAFDAGRREEYHKYLKVLTQCQVSASRDIPQYYVDTYKCLRESY